MKFTSFLILPVFLITSTAFADSFSDASAAMDQAFSEQNKMFSTEVQKQDQAWDNYIAAQNRAWKKYNAEIEAVWGADNLKIPSKKEWVDYSKKRNERSSIDFEKGTLKIDIILKPGEKSESQEVQKRIENRLKTIISEPTHLDKALKIPVPTTSVASGAKKKSVYPLAGQLALPNGKIVTKKNAAVFAKYIVKSKPLKHKMIDTPKGKRQVVSISVSLIPNHMKKRIKPYIPRVMEMAKRFDIPPSLILGIMQTESAFNPMARSGVPAYGLMQLVPRSGALDAYEYVFKDKKVVPAEYLYIASNNIELGSAYLKLLQIREMRRIKNPKTRMICAIAAYNTGGGNVAKAFIPGSRNIRKASVIINTMSYEQVYEQLRTKLPYEETQRYVMKVRKHMKNFTRLDGEI